MDKAMRQVLWQKHRAMTLMQALAR